MQHRICQAGLLLAACFVSAALWAEDRLSALGIGVSDLQASTAFYVDVLDLEVLRTYELGYLNEVVLGYPDSSGAVLVLMHWPQQQRNYDGNEVKLVFDVEDPAAILGRIRARGGQVDMEAGPIEAVPGAIIGFGRDPDNYVIELIKR